MIYNIYFWAVIGALVIGFVEGGTFSYLVGDRGEPRSRDVAVGMIGGILGFLFSLFAPVLPGYELPLSLAFSAHICVISLFVYFSTFHERSKLGEVFDHNWPLNS